jgi:hypothetical protein
MQKILPGWISPLRKKAMQDGTRGYTASRGRMSEKAVAYQVLHAIITQ